MRNRFEMQLEELNVSLIKMGALCETAISMAVKALLNDDTALVDGVKETERELDHMERSIEGLCMKLILQQQPVARDLRTISSALKMITDMERIGDQAADIANLIKFCRMDEAGSRCREDITRMAEAAIKMVTASVDAFVKLDMDGAKKVISDDDEVDGLFIKIKGDIINIIAENPGLGETVFDIVMIAKYLERIGDHATNIAEWVVFSITGEHGNA
ncbi:phosphate signaling complex protein PhoU [Huintestinicola sp.]|uniref:phosphate signaling complex protein PhoU n=1 Tax=Huintestinicola sp. TaxID=2981661 RepID=UPI003D7D11AD